jgi:feruloyl esterase
MRSLGFSEKTSISRVGPLVFGLSVLFTSAYSYSRDVTASLEDNCLSLQRADFSTLQDAPTQISQVQLVQAEDKYPAYCRVSGYVAPQVGFELRLPLANWNGKFIEIGCGGGCGHLGWTFWCPVQRGYACIVSDLGHESGFIDNYLWAFNNLPAQLDWGIRGAHVAALAGKAIIERFYRRGPDRSYFMGCSKGGHSALVAAQRFPRDFDGIVGIAGVPYEAQLAMYQLWAVQVMTGANGEPLLRKSDLQLVHNAVLSRCDADDGVKDGIVGEPYQCDFDPSSLICKAGTQEGCLTNAQAEAVKKIYAGPISSTGDKKNYLRGAAPGSELGWLEYDAKALRDFFRHMAFMPSVDPTWKLADFDFSRDHERLAMTEALWDASNPDLRKFKQAGGKLLMVQGWNDQFVVPDQQIDYYETVMKTMGGLATTQNFFRLFMVPGMEHCTGGDGAFAIDYMTYLEDWVERGQAPDKLIGAHVQGNGYGLLSLQFPLNSADVAFTRPFFPYPLRARYRSGDRNAAESFEAERP